MGVHRASICICGTYQFVRYKGRNASKIIEALLHNRGIVSTIAYTQLKDINFITTERSVEGFIATLEEISGISSRELSKYVNQGEKVSKAFSGKVWNDYMNKIENHSI